jgi:hypothetical protein
MRAALNGRWLSNYKVTGRHNILQKDTQINTDSMKTFSIQTLRIPINGFNCHLVLAMESWVYKNPILSPKALQEFVLVHSK